MKPVIFFDWDGTIVDSMDLCVEGVLVTMRKMGLPEPSVALCEACNADGVQCIGTKFVLYKRNDKEPKIVLVKDKKK